MHTPSRRGVPARFVRRWAAAGVLALVASALPVLSPAAAAAADPPLNCATTALFHSSRATGFFEYSHSNPTSGTSSWSTSVAVSSGWEAMRAIGGPGALIYRARADGRLEEQRRTPAGWQAYPDGNTSHTISAAGTGWDRYTNAAYRNLVTVDSLGHFYTVEADGNLHWRSYDSATGTWKHRVVASGWGRYNLIAAAGEGTIYARDAVEGTITRFGFSADANRIRRLGTPAQIVPGPWNQYSRIISPGADILYLVKPDGEVRWTRLHNLDPFPSFTGQVVTTSGLQDDVDTVVTSDACKWSTTPPTAPSVPTTTTGTVSMTRSATGVHYAYVSPGGVGVYARVTDLYAGPNLTGAVPGMTGLTGTITIAENLDGRAQLQGLTTGAHLLRATRTALGGWEPTADDSGWATTNAITLLGADGKLHSFSQGPGTTITSVQVAQNGPIPSWSPGPGPATTGPLTAVVTGGRGRLFTTLPTGELWSLPFASNDLTERGSWAVVTPGTQVVGRARGVVLSDGKIRLFATFPDGTVRTTVEDANNAFTGTWTLLPTTTAAGAPSAVLAPDGKLHVVVRGTDGYVYHSGQTGVGSSAYTDWEETTGYAHQSNTDPTAQNFPSSAPGQNTWVIGFLDDADSPRMLRAASTTGLAAAAQTFIEVPMVGTP